MLALQYRVPVAVNMVDGRELCVCADYFDLGVRINISPIAVYYINPLVFPVGGGGGPLKPTRALWPRMMMSEEPRASLILLRLSMICTSKLLEPFVMDDDVRRITRIADSSSSSFMICFSSEVGASTNRYCVILAPSFH